MESESGQPTIAIVGSGPSGCYTAQFFRKIWPTAQIAVFDALATPYGLVRYGVAPDHQGTKAVTAQFDRLFDRAGVEFVGNVRIGDDIPFDTLTTAFDVVILATGLTCDRMLDVGRDSRARVIGAGEMLRALNGYPGLAGASQLQLPLGRGIAVVGNGNVAIDAVRLLAKEDLDLAGTDIDDDVWKRLRPEPLECVDVIGRSPASKAKFDLAMIKELGSLPNVDFEVDGIQPSDSGALVEAFREMVHRPKSSAQRPTVVRFHFDRTPIGLEYHSGRTSLVTRIADDAARVERYSVDAVVTAIGFETDNAVPRGWEGPNVWRVGWANRGPRGGIPDNRRDAQSVTESVAASIEGGSLTLGGPGLASIWPAICHRATNFAGWRRLDSVERASGGPHRIRRKVADLADMARVAAPDRYAHLIGSEDTHDY